MCECCSNQAVAHQGHIHVNDVHCANCFNKLQKALADIPGVAGVEFVSEAQQAKVIFDRRIVNIASLEQIVTESGFFVS